MDCRDDMRRVFFDVADDGVLVYLDPMIGRYENARHDLVVRLNETDRLLELRVRGRRARTFDLAAGVEFACQEASSAYFRTLVKLCEFARNPKLRLVS